MRHASRNKNSVNYYTAWVIKSLFPLALMVELQSLKVGPIKVSVSFYMKLPPGDMVIVSPRSDSFGAGFDTAVSGSFCMKLPPGGMMKVSLQMGVLWNIICLRSHHRVFRVSHRPTELSNHRSCHAVFLSQELC